MAETVREVNYYYITASNKPGEGAALASIFKDAGVSLLAMHAFPVRRRVQVDFVPEDARAFTSFARKAKLKLSPRKKAFLVEGTDRTGALLPVLTKLADAEHQHHRHHGHRRGQEALRRHFLGEFQRPAQGRESPGGVEGSAPTEKEGAECLLSRQSRAGGGQIRPRREGGTGTP